MITGSGTTAAYTRELFGEVDWLWICHDTPVQQDGSPATFQSMKTVVDMIDQSPLQDVVISTQLPVGSCAALEGLFPYRRFAVVPENYRTTQSRPVVDRFVIGTRDETVRRLVRKRLFRYPCVFMDPESAEMVKHALNGFLALSVVYSKEIAGIAAQHGADPGLVAAGIQSDPRIGTRSYLKPGGDPGPHLIREVKNLQALGSGELIEALVASCSR